LVAIAAALATVTFGPAEGGFDKGDVIYPIFFLPTPHTYGTIGLFSALLAVAAVGAGWSRAGALLLGLLPALHASIGLVVVGATATALIWHRLTDAGGPNVGWLSAGLTLSAASFAIHRLTFADIPPVPPDAGTYLDAFVGFWDAHRQQVNWGSKAVRANWAIPVIATTLLSWRGARFTPSFRFLLRSLLVMGLLSLPLAAITHVPPGQLPSWLVIAMPGRVLNVNVTAFVALILGLAATLSLPTVPAHGNPAGATRPGAAAIAGVALVSVAAGTGAYHVVGQNTTPLADRFALPPRDAAFQAATRGQGVLLTSGSLWLIQLRTRRPVLIDGGTLDTLPYALPSAPRTDRILREIYGTSLFAPPPEARNSGTIPGDWTRRVWESYSLDAWRRIGREWNVTQVFSYGDWRLDLPRVARSRDFALYQIPR
jgi:hypothetical protein